MNRDDVDFVRDQIYAWIGNLMRDADAQGYALDLMDVTVALEEVAFKLDQRPDAEDFDEFLRDLNDGRGNE